jgi:outer membrane protein assembly factor BamB
MRKLLYGLFAATFLICSFNTAHGAKTPGTLKWSYETAVNAWSVITSPAIGNDGTVYVAGDDDGKFYAFNPDGTLKWVHHGAIEAYPSTPAIGADGTIYVGGCNESGKLFAFNPDGTLKWTYDTAITGGRLANPSIGGNGVIYSAIGNRLYAVNPNGTYKWHYTIGHFNVTDPAIGGDGTIYVGSYYGLYAFNPDGTRKWFYGKRVSSPSIGADGTIYAGGSSDGYLYAFNPDGTLKWSHNTAINGLTISSSPSIGADGTIYVVAYDESTKLFAFNPDGTPKWPSAIEVLNSCCSPAIGTDGTIYVGFNAFNPDGTLQWSYLVGWDSYTSTAIGPDGTVYVGTHFGSLFALNSVSEGLANSSWPMFHHDSKRTGSLAPLSALPILAITRTGTGSGTITSAPSGINCGDTCRASYTSGALVTLTAAPAVGSTFAGWSGGGCSGTATCAVTMNSDTTVTATFNAIPYVLSASIQGSGAIAATDLTCNGTSCSGNYPYNTIVSLTATPAPGAGFVSWTGCTASNGTTCSVTMTSNKNVTATFTSLNPCAYAISPSSKAFNDKAGTVNVTVTGKGAKGVVCAAPVVTPSDPSWIGAAPGVWKNNKETVKVTVTANTTSSDRPGGSVAIADKTFAITQKGAACAITALAPASQPIPVGGGSSYHFALSVFPADCEWTVASNKSWITLATTGGAGSATVNYTVPVNTTKRNQSGAITVTLAKNGKKKTQTVTQKGK